MDILSRLKRSVRVQDLIQSKEGCREGICYGCGNLIVEHTPNCNTWTHMEFQDCNGPVRPKTEGNDRGMNWQADETAEEYKDRIFKYYGEKNE